MSASVESRPKRIFRIIYSTTCGFFWYYSPLNKFRKMKFMSDKETVEAFLNGKSIARYGDGELRIIGNIPSDFYQKNDNELAEKLTDIAKNNNKNLIICFPKPLKTLKGMTLKAKMFWISNVFWNRKIWKKCINLDKIYGNTQITRPYIDYKNKNGAKTRYDILKKIWNGRDICIIEGEDTHLGVGNDLFVNAKSVKRIIAPAKNAFDEFGKIFEKAKKVQKDCIFLIALGPTAPVLAYELSKRGRVAFDAGHIDIEYEWMRAGVKRKIAIEGKAVNENKNSRNIRINKAIKQVELEDFLALLKFVILLIPSLLFKLSNKMRRKKLWLVAEEGEARDNGYCFYKYMRTSHPNVRCFYAIKKDSCGYNKIAKFGNTIWYGSLKHWLYYMAADLNISSQKNGNPCPIFWYLIHVTFGLYRNRVFLQHGLTHNSSEWLHHKKTKFKYFVCGAEREYNYLFSELGYKKNQLLLTGFSRWDYLKDISKRQKRKSILIMPTWRSWLINSVDEVKFMTEDFYLYWNDLLVNKQFIKFVEKNDINIYFYPHINMKKYLSVFKSFSDNIKILSPNDDIQEYFAKCSLMITDYSSVAFDFAYLYKPVIYYQFDVDRYRRQQLQKGYFDYEKDGFGPVVKNEVELLRCVQHYLDVRFELYPRYMMRVQKFFPPHSGNNSKKIYEALNEKK